MEISNPRRILAVGLPESGVLSVLKDLTGDAPSPLDSSTAGLTHTWHVKTAYYSADIPIWLDEINDVEAWKSEFLKDEAKEVVGVVAAWVFAFRKPQKDEDLALIKEIMRGLSQIIRKTWSYSWDGVCLAVATKQSIKPHLDVNFDEWEEICREFEFEFIDAEAKGRNEFGEPVGIARVKEALEANEWEGSTPNIYDDADSDPTDSFNEMFEAEEAEMGAELLGMKAAINGGDETVSAAQVEELEHMMTKMQAVKEKGATMPEAERKKFAARAVNDIMGSF